MTQPENNFKHFSDFALPATLLRAVQAVGYETPTPIQSNTIPPLLEGHDVLGHAPTGTGKTAAFALPLLARLDVKSNVVQTIVLTPTRELAIQVAEAFTRYATHIPELRILPIYGGQEYGGQVRQLKRGVQVVVGTPGRVMDHMRRGTLKLDKLSALVLDEADEMLRMGFIDDVEWILEQAPDTRQMALFSATMPKQIKRIASRHLKNPIEISVEGPKKSASTIRQRFWMVSGLHKLDALTRILEVERFDAILVFVRTRTATVELAERLSARGFSTAAMNGDMAQSQREQMVDKLKSGKLDILVATDVVARGLDVDRISHVVNYDIPYDTEAYIHRIGRTGRAGRSGEAILFVTPREQRLLHSIEKATRQKIDKLELPTVEMVNNRRIADFKQGISDTLAKGQLSFLQQLINEYVNEHDVPAERVAAALAELCLRGQSLQLKEDKHVGKSAKNKQKKDKGPRKRVNTAMEQRVTDAVLSGAADRPPRHEKTNSRSSERQRTSPTKQHSNAVQMEAFRVEVGANHNVKPSNLVGAIANEAGLDSEFIGHIRINEDHSIVELPEGMPKFLLKDLKRVWVCNQRLNISRVADGAQHGGSNAQAGSDKPNFDKHKERGDKKRAGAKNTKNKKTDKQKARKRKEKKRRQKNKDISSA